MEKWLKKNLQYITIIFIALFLIKNVQSCNRKMSLKIQTKTLTETCDSLNKSKDQIIDSLNQEILSREFLIRDLGAELKVAGVKYDEAQKRADAVQKTASSIRANTTIEVRGDSTKIRK